MFLLEQVIVELLNLVISVYYLATVFSIVQVFYFQHVTFQHVLVL
jgi:hypothetical protein